jgi:hypothetical protein
MFTLPGIGFQSRAAEASALRLRPVALVQLIATLALVLCTLIAATVVSIGFARADLDVSRAPVAVAPLPAVH